FFYKVTALIGEAFGISKIIKSLSRKKSEEKDYKHSFSSFVDAIPGR
ncbi:unnamed protein product, partial [marine sediment metagenome]